MFKKVISVTIISVIITFYCGDKSCDIISSLVSIVLFSNKTPSRITPKKLFTNEELKLYNGINKPQIYLAILGNVFDVSRSNKYYGLNQQYSIFVGRDTSRSFVTGKFDIKDVSDEVADLNHQELRSLNHWLNFYSKEYKRIGKVIGKYFDENGNETPYGKAVKNLLNDAELAKEKDDLEKSKFPPCNVEWEAERGTRVWCSERSGGITREWTGVPRQLYEPELKTYRCACIGEHNKHLATIKEYEGCDKNSLSCNVR